MSTLPDNHRVAVEHLHALVEVFQRALDNQLAPAGLTAFEYRLLRALSQASDHRLRLTALATTTAATLPRLSRVASSLERRGLVDRVPCPADGRATNAVLTKAGSRALEIAEPLYTAAVQELIVDPLGEAGMTELDHVTSVVLSALEPECEKAASS